MATNMTTSRFIKVMGDRAGEFATISRTGTQTKIEQKLENLAIEAYKAKIDAEKAADEAKEKLHAVYTELIKNGLDGVSTTDPKVLEDLGLNKILEVVESTRTNSTADAKAFAELVTEEEFWAAVRVQMTEAKKFVLEKHWDKFITEGEPTKFPQIKAK